jgi:hypothetical protein
LTGLDVNPAATTFLCIAGVVLICRPWLARVATRDNRGMPMREDCVHFESRIYASGEVARFCTLGLAPEAPWRCPDNCSRFQHSGINVATDAALARPPVEDEPDDTADNIEGVLADAEAIVEEAEPGALRDLDDTSRKPRRWWPFTKRPPDDGDTGRLSNR